MVDSPAAGTGEFIRPCGDELRPAVPDHPEAGPTVGMTFSGGGFRATFPALGVVRFLADAGLLGTTRYVSSVSGGSIANGLLARNWATLRARQFSAAAVDEVLVEPAVKRVSSRSLKLSLVGGVWRTLGAATRTDLLARQLDRWFFDGLLLEDLEPQVRWVVNAANIVTGVRFTFERDVVGDYVTGLAPTSGSSLRLAQAAAASAAVPGAFAAWPVKGISFPCGWPTPVLLDGGVYDNTGLEVLDSERYRYVFTVSMNAGGLLRPGGYGRVPLVRDLARANALLYRQSTSLRTRMMVASFQGGRGTPLDGELPPGARRGVLVALATSFAAESGDALSAWRERFPEHRSWAGRDLALVPTVFDKLDRGLCERLVYRGWWLAGAAMARYYPELAPAPTAVTPPPDGGR
jgi:NTE family protein